MFKWFCDNRNLNSYCSLWYFSIQFCTQRWHQLSIHYAPPTAYIRELIISAWYLTHHVFLAASRTPPIHVCLHVYILVWPIKYFLRSAAIYWRFLLFGKGRLNAFHLQENEELSGFHNAGDDYVIHMHTYRHLHVSMFVCDCLLSYIGVTEIVSL